MPASKKSTRRTTSRTTSKTTSRKVKNKRLKKVNGGTWNPGNL